MNTMSLAITTATNKCLYRSKPCYAPRAIKMNGEFHKLCELHRRRANLNQQRVHHRRKLREYGQKQQQEQKQQAKLLRCMIPPASESPLSCGPVSPTSADKYFDDDLFNDIDIELGFECEPSASPCGDLPLPDLEILEHLLAEPVSSIMCTQPKSQFAFLELELCEL